jgi:hypothetical protein
MTVNRAFPVREQLAHTVLTSRSLSTRVCSGNADSCAKIHSNLIIRGTTQIVCQKLHAPEEL